MNALEVLSAIPRDRLLPVPLALRETVEPLILTAPVVLPAVKVDPEEEATVVFPTDERVVKYPAEGLRAPITVELIPVASTLKLDEVNKVLLLPTSNVNPERPVAEILPDVPFIFKAPVVRVKPFDAVRLPDAVIVPNKP